MSDLVIEPHFKQNQLIQFRDSMNKIWLINPASISDIEYNFPTSDNNWIGDKFAIIRMNSGAIITVTTECDNVMKKIGIDPSQSINNPVRNSN
jgi:hypothetical protein